MPEQQDIIQAKAALKTMHTHGWSYENYMNLQLACYKNRGYNKEALDYAKSVFRAAINQLRPRQLKRSLFE